MANGTLLKATVWANFTQHYNDIAQVSFTGSYIEVEKDSWLDEFWQTQNQIYIQYALGVISKDGTHRFVGFPDGPGSVFPPLSYTYSTKGAVGLWFHREVLGGWARYYLYGSHFDSPFYGLDDITLWGADSPTSVAGDESTLTFNIIHAHPNGMLGVVNVPTAGIWADNGNFATTRVPGYSLIWHGVDIGVASFDVLPIEVEIDAPLVIEVVLGEDFIATAPETIVVTIEDPLVIEVEIPTPIWLEQYIEPVIHANVVFEKLTGDKVSITFDGSFIDVPKDSWLDQFWSSHSAIPVQYALGVKLAHQIKCMIKPGAGVCDSISTTIYPILREFIEYEEPATSMTGSALVDSILTTVYPI